MLFQPVYEIHEAQHHQHSLLTSVKNETWETAEGASLLIKITSWGDRFSYHEAARANEKIPK